MSAGGENPAVGPGDEKGFAATPSRPARIAVPLAAFVFGLLLAGLGLLAYFAFAVGEDRSWTALIPALWGAPIMICAVAVLAAEMIPGASDDCRTKTRKHAMHVVAVLALLGVIAPLVRIATTAGKSGVLTLDAKSGTQFAMAALCAALLAVAVASFIAVRRAQRREAETRPEPSELENLKDN